MSRRKKREIVNLNKVYFADTETASEADVNREGKAFVWLWGLMDSNKKFIYGQKIDGLISKIENLENGSIVYFHNLKFDIKFILPFLLKNGYMSIIDKKLKLKTFKIIGDSQVIYQLTIKTSAGVEIRICDSLKMFPAKISEIGEILGEKKLTDDIDYEREHFVDDEIDEKELGYMKRDIDILADVMLHHFNEYPEFYLTRSSLSYNLWLQTISPRNFKKYLPTLDVEEDNYIRKAYAGGLTHVVDKYRNVLIDNPGFSLDCNSMHPSSMLKPMPVGHGVGGVDYSKMNDNFKNKYPLFIQTFKAVFKLKKNHFPSLPKKFMKADRTAVNSSDDLLDVYHKNGLKLTNLDLKHFYHNYDILEIKYTSFIAFEQKEDLFKEYIEKYASLKAEASKNKEKLKKLMYKLLLNGLYGKFGQNPLQPATVALFDKNGIQKFQKVESLDNVDFEKYNAKYLPIAVFTTAYSRDNLLNVAEPLCEKNQLSYVDTDSCHTNTKNIDLSKFNIDDNILGFWKNESDYEASIYLREKTYIEVNKYDENKTVNIFKNHKTHFIIKAAGLSAEAKSTIKTLDDFTLDKTYAGNLTQKSCVGGCYLKKVDKFISSSKRMF